MPYKATATSALPEYSNHPLSSRARFDRQENRRQWIAIDIGKFGVDLLGVEQGGGVDHVQQIIPRSAGEKKVLSGEKMPATGASALPASLTLLSVPSVPAVSTVCRPATVRPRRGRRGGAAIGNESLQRVGGGDHLVDVGNAVCRQRSLVDHRGRVEDDARGLPVGVRRAGDRCGDR